MVLEIFVFLVLLKLSPAEELVAAALCENTKNKYRKNNQHDKIIELLPFDNMEGLVSIQEIKYLEKNSCVSVNVSVNDSLPLLYI